MPSSPADKNYRITLYLDTPKAMLRPFRDFFKHNHLESLICENSLNPVAFTGHAFIGLTDADGKEKRWGYTCEEAALFRSLSGMPGKIVEEDHESPYNEAIMWTVSKDQFLAARKAIQKEAENPGVYKLFEKNCATVAAGILKAAGVPDIPQGKLSLTPHGMVIKKRMMLAERRLETAKFKIKNFFNALSGKKKAPSSELLDSLRSKPVPVPIKQAMKHFKKDRKNNETTPIDFNRVVSSLARIRS